MIAKIITAVAFYLLYWFCCFLGTGTDKKNLIGLRSYPDEVQQIVKNEPIEIPKSTSELSCAEYRCLPSLRQSRQES